MTTFKSADLASSRFSNFADALIDLRHAQDPAAQTLASEHVPLLLRIFHPHDARFEDLDRSTRQVLEVLTRHEQALRQGNAPVDGVMTFTASWLEGRWDGSGFSKVMGSLETAVYTDVQDLRDRVLPLDDDGAEVLADYAFLLKSIEGLTQDVYWVLRQQGPALLPPLEAEIHALPGTAQDLILHALEATAGTAEGQGFYERFIEKTDETWLKAAAETYMSRTRNQE